MTYLHLVRRALAGPPRAGLAAVLLGLIGCQDPAPYLPLPEEIVFDCPVDCEDCTVPEPCAGLGLTAPIAVGADWTLDARALGVPVDLDVPDYVERRQLGAQIGDAAILTQQAATSGRFLLRAVGAGISAVVVHDDAGTLLDVVHVRTAVADALELDVVTATGRVPAPAPLELSVGEVVKLAVTPTRGGRRLGGDATATWSAAAEPDTGEPIGLNVEPNAPAVIEVTALTAGDSTLSASFASIDAELRLVVR